jgi:hypothetical protein
MRSIITLLILALAVPGAWGREYHVAIPGNDSDQAATGRPNILIILADDLGETKNLAAATPEKVAEMQKVLERLIADGRSTPGAAQKNDVEVKRLTRETEQ